jgi:hypothetical protein
MVITIELAKKYSLYGHVECLINWVGNGIYVRGKSSLICLYLALFVYYKQFNNYHKVITLYIFK